MQILKPKEDIFKNNSYIVTAQGNDLINELELLMDITIDLYSNLSLKQLQYKYAEGKWSIQEILQHLIDTERVFAYRAMRFSRKDATALSGFDENVYAAQARADERVPMHLIEEFRLIRLATIILFKSMQEDNLDFMAYANDKQTSARALGWMIVGHNQHHLNVIQEKYGVN